MTITPKASTVIALETSCDETAVAILTLKAGILKVLANQISSQMEEHACWGGVVPEIASRRHLEALPYLLDKAISQSGISMKEINAVAATVTPGLTGALLAGSISGRTLACLHGIPFLGIHHLEGHLSSVLLSESPPSPPYLVLLVSGGHTELIKVDRYNEFIRLGRSHDDAAGEAFDKVGRLLGLGYPGGPAIEKIARNGEARRFKLPKGRVSKPGGGFYPYDFSFSGLKTAMFRKISQLKEEPFPLPIEDLAASFENIVAEVLVERTIRCALDQEINSIVMVGGVAANTRLRKMISKQASCNGIAVHLAPPAFCTDNAAMIGSAALFRLELGVRSSSIELGVSARWPLAMAHSLYDQKPPF